MIRVFIGYDPRQPIAYNVVAHSVATRASVPTAITRLQLAQLPIKRRGLTEFTYSRFLVPWLSKYEGWSIFMDADMLCLGDVAELLVAGVANPDAAVHVVKKGKRFEWPSLMVFSNERCKVLTPEYVEDPANNLYDLAWAEEVGELPHRWNHIVGYDEPCENPKLIHYTQGIPVWPETKGCEHAQAWVREYQTMNSSVSFQDLMGASVHVKHMAKAS